MEDQIKRNVEADEIVGEIISSALQYLTVMSQGQLPQAQPYLDALESILVTDEASLKVTDLSAKLPSPYPKRKSVTFSKNDYSESRTSLEPRTPGPESSVYFAYDSDDDDIDLNEIEITRL